MLQGRSAGVSALVCVSITLALAGCGTATQPTGAPSRASSSISIPEVHSASRAVQKPIAGRLLLEVNTVCRAVRQGAPPALQAPYTPASVTRYATSAQAPTRRTFVSLERLSATPGASTLERIAKGYAQLQAVYATAGLIARNAHGARQVGAAIQAREQFITATARSAGAPACGVVGR